MKSSIEKPEYRPLIYVTRDDPKSLWNMKEDFCTHLDSGQSLLLHVDGTRSTSSGQHVQDISAMWLDVAQKVMLLLYQ